MCQWHMFSTDRSRAEMREHAVQSNPVSEGSKVFDPKIYEGGFRSKRRGIPQFPFIRNLVPRPMAVNVVYRIHFREIHRHELPYLLHIVKKRPGTDQYAKWTLGVHDDRRNHIWEF